MDFRPAIVSAIAIASLDTSPAPVDNVETQCDGSGWIRQGDGHVTKCPGCPNCKKGSFSAKPCGTACKCTTCDCTDKKECLTKPIADKLCCGDNCVCEAGKCTCSPAQECLQGGAKPLLNGQALAVADNIQVCDGNSCCQYKTYEAAYVESVNTGRGMLVVSGGTPDEWARVKAGMAKNDTRIFCVQSNPNQALPKGTHSFSAPKKVVTKSMPTTQQIFSSGGCSSCSRGMRRR